MTGSNVVTTLSIQVKLKEMVTTIESMLSFLLGLVENYML
jgi:hypothetical protein